MKVNTSRFGEVEIDESLIFNFVEPIIGYENLSKFFLLDYLPNSLFKWLQSAENPDVAFPITFPAFYQIDYQFVIPEDKAKKLEVANAENVLSFNIVCIPNGCPQFATINLIGPIVVNTENKKSMQLVLTNTNYSVKHRLFVESLDKKEESQEAKV